MMHEFVMSLEGLKNKTGISAMDVAKGLLDYGIHPPTMYFPMIVEEALMVEPTETEPKEVLDEAIDVFHKIYQQAQSDAETLHHGHRAGVLRKGFSCSQGVIRHPQRLQDSERALLCAGIAFLMPGGMNGIIDGMTIGVEFRHNQCLLLCLRGAPHPVVPDGFNDVGAHQGQLLWRQCLFAGSNEITLLLVLFRRTDFHAVFHTAVPRIKQAGITTNEDHHRYTFGG